MSEYSKSFFIKTILKEGKWFLGISFIILLYFFINFFWFNAHFTSLDYFSILISLFVFFYTIFFLRPPSHFPSSNPNAIYSSADGHILSIEKNVACPYDSEKQYHKIIVFMNVASMHWNQSPIEGTIVFDEFNKGLFKNALHADNNWQDNEHQVIGIQNDKINVFVVMVAGLIARRIRFFKKKEDQLKQGTILGLIRYGSANILYIPSEFDIHVLLKQKVRSGQTVLAYKKEDNS